MSVSMGTSSDAVCSGIEDWPASEGGGSLSISMGTSSDAVSSAIEESACSSSLLSSSRESLCAFNSWKACDMVSIVLFPNYSCFLEVKQSSTLAVLVTFHDLVLLAL